LQLPRRPFRHRCDEDDVGVVDPPVHVLGGVAHDPGKVVGQPGAGGRGDVNDAGHQPAVLAEPDVGGVHEFERQDGLPHLADNRIGQVSFDRRRPLVRKVADRAPDMGESVVQDRHRNDDGRAGIDPPPADQDASDPEEGCHPGHPVGFLHAGVGHQDLVVDRPRERQLQPAEDYRRDGAVQDRRQHQPRLRNGGAKHDDIADHRPLGGEEGNHVLDEQEDAEEKRRHRPDEIGNGDRTKRAEGEPPTRRLALDAYRHEEGDGGRDRDEVLDERTPDCLRCAGDEEEGERRRQESADGHPFQPYGARPDRRLVGWPAERPLLHVRHYTTSATNGAPRANAGSLRAFRRDRNQTGLAAV